jgi:hypothetical protein
MSCLCALVCCALLPCALPAGHTAQAGGNGGDRTADMDCGSNAFIVGMSATGGKDSPFGMNLVRTVKFRCLAFNGTTPASFGSDTRGASGTSTATIATTDDSVECRRGLVVGRIVVNAGTFIDQIRSVGCIDINGKYTDLNLNVGGEGGTYHELRCPPGEGLYKVTARFGATIDAIIGTCRTFGGLDNAPLDAEIQLSLLPKPSKNNPVKILPGRSADFTFVVPPRGAHATLQLLVSGSTDLLGGGDLNPPDYRWDVVSPAGQLIASHTINMVGNKGGATRINFDVTFNADGRWILHVVNRKKDIGALDVSNVLFMPQ